MTNTILYILKMSLNAFINKEILDLMLAWSKAPTKYAHGVFYFFVCSRKDTLMDENIGILS